MVDNKNKIFYQTIDKLNRTLEKKVYKYYINKKYGGKVDYYELKKLILYLTYLENINKSKYTYYFVNGLTDISNSLNKI